MQKNIIVITVIMLCMMTVVGCQQKKMRTDLLTAENIMDAHPDSAYTLLAKIKHAEKLADHDKALYLLLNTQAKWKTDRDITHDSLLDYPITYFLKTGDKVRLAKSYYYKGVVCQEQKHDFMALPLYLKAREIIQKTNDLHYSVYINEYIGYIYHNRYMDREAYKYFLDANKNAKMDKDTIAIVNTLVEINNRNMNTDNYKQMLDNGMEALGMLRNYHADSSIVNTVYGDIALAYYHLRKYDKALLYNDSSLIFSNDSANICIANGLQGSILLKTGHYDQAEKYLTVCGKGRKLQDSIVYAKGMYEIAIHRKDFANTVKYGNMYANLYINTYDHDKRYELVRLQKEYDEAIKDRNLEKEKAGNMQMKLIAVSLAIAITGVISLLVWIYRKHKKMKREKYMMEDELMMKSDIIHDFDTKMDESDKSIADLQTRITEIKKLAEIDHKKHASLLTNLEMQLENVMNEKQQMLTHISERGVNLIKLFSTDYEYDVKTLINISKIDKKKALTQSEWQCIYRLVHAIDPTLKGNLEESGICAERDMGVILLSILGIKPRVIAHIFDVLPTSISREKNRIKHKLQESGNDMLYSRIGNLL